MSAGAAGSPFNQGGPFSGGVAAERAAHLVAICCVDALRCLEGNFGPLFRPAQSLLFFKAVSRCVGVVPVTSLTSPGSDVVLFIPDGELFPAAVRSDRLRRRLYHKLMRRAEFFVAGADSERVSCCFCRALFCYSGPRAFAMMKAALGVGFDSVLRCFGRGFSGFCSGCAKVLPDDGLSRSSTLAACFDSALMLSHVDPFLVSYVSQHGQDSAALFIDPARVALPAATARVVVTDLLRTDDPLRSLLLDPTAGLLVAGALPVGSAKAAFMIGRREFIVLLRKLLDLDMVRALPSAEVPRAVNGLFGVPKSGSEEIRLILDCRPANRLFCPPLPPNLPTPSELGGVVIAPGFALTVGKCDLQSYFYQLRLPEWLHCFFALPAVSVHELLSLGFSDDYLGDIVGQQAASLAPVFFCFTVIPMGWSHSVTVAQAVHASVLEDAGASLTEPGSHAFVLSGHYVDDAFWISAAARTEESRIAHDRVRLRQEAYVSECQERGLAVNHSKTVLGSVVPVLGLELDGEQGTYGLALVPLRDLVSRSLVFLSADSVSLGALRSLLGHWLWALLVVRPTLSILNNVFHFVQRFSARPPAFTVRLWPSVRHELMAVCALAPMMFCNLRRSFFGKAFATDASSGGWGVCHADLSRHPAYVGHVADIDAVGVGLARDFVVPPVGSLSWVVIQSDRFRFAEHINALELRAVYQCLLRQYVSDPSFAETTVLIYLDSLVAHACLVKGRSSSFGLLAVLRKIAVILLCADVRLLPVWVPSAQNPADAPSRVVMDVGRIAVADDVTSFDCHVGTH